ncbi:MAG: 4a-hydroxytetrahydrobiopterin dehydratase [Deltaproteobacteria bacterium]|nr:4a-hydroxytetrahydrobiopterin dehydratase [Deltaproteobacteria bacterium]
MPRPKALAASELEARLAALPGWSLVDGKLHRDFRFPDFVEAFAFMTAAALCAEKLDHHPEWSNVYAKVSVDLVTHDAKGITELDFELARRMSAIAERTETGRTE